MLMKALRTHTDAHEIDEEKKYLPRNVETNHKTKSTLSKNETSKRRGRNQTE